MFIKHRTTSLYRRPEQLLHATQMCHVGPCNKYVRVSLFKRWTTVSPYLTNRYKKGRVTGLKRPQKSVAFGKGLKKPPKSPSRGEADGSTFAITSDTEQTFFIHQLQSAEQNAGSREESAYCRRVL